MGCYHWLDYYRACCPCRWESCRCPCPGARAVLTGVKRDQLTGAPLAGAAYTLYQNGQAVATATSDATGTLTFPGLSSGEYDLVETTPPSGYQPDPRQRHVVVNADGTVTMDGRSGESFLLEDAPLAVLAFQKVDALTGAALAGAVFTLSNGRSVVSGADGRVDFGTLAPGVYTLRESGVPAGYAPNPQEYTVVVAEDGTVTVGGVPLESFSVSNAPALPLSERPVIYSYYEGDSIISGAGVPGAQIEVIFPDGTRDAATVAQDGTWTLPVPEGVTLRAGETVYANQTVPGYAPSENASFLIQERT